MILLAATKKKKKTKPVLRYVAAASVLLLFLLYIAYQIYTIVTPSVQTQTAYVAQEYKTIDTQVYVIRDEAEVQGSASGVVVPAVSNGSRVAKDDTVAYVFADNASAENYAKSLTVKEEIARCDSFTSSSAGLTDVERLDDDVDASFFDLIAALDGRDYTLAGEAADEFNNTLTRFKVATGEQIDFSQKKAALQSQLDTLNQGIRQVSSITASSAGYYVGSVDGYEHLVDYSTVSDLTADQVDALLHSSAAPASPSSAALGKLIRNFDWYLVCTVETKQIADLVVGASIPVALPNAVSERIQTTVHAIHNSPDGRSALILECNRMDEQLATLRLENARIILEEHKGLKIPTGAIRINEENEKGVYVVKGNIALFKRIEILYTGADYVLVDPSAEGTEVKIYDQVITEGKDVSDGKIIH